MFGLRGTELLLILVVLLLLFGATRLPQLGSSLGSAIRNFKKGFTTNDESGDDSADAKGGQTLQAGGVEPSAKEKVSATREG